MQQSSKINRPRTAGRKATAPPFANFLVVVFGLHGFNIYLVLFARAYLVSVFFNYKIMWGLNDPKMAIFDPKMAISAILLNVSVYLYFFAVLMAPKYV